MNRARPPLRLAIVGPCAAGKSTLARSLQARGYEARQIVQEHSFVPYMWQVLTRPDLLIYLDASYDTCTRRKGLDWTPQEHAEQLRRLRHARQHCHIYIQTDTLTPEDVLESVLQKIASIRPSDGPR